MGFLSWQENFDLCVILSAPSRTRFGNTNGLKKKRENAKSENEREGGKFDKKKDIKEKKKRNRESFNRFQGGNSMGGGDE